MSALVLFDDIEAWGVATIAAALAGRDEDYAQDVTVSTEVPSTRTARMVTIRRDGGGRLDVAREQPRLGINVYGPDTDDGDTQASDLARLVCALLWAAPDGDPVCKVSITGGPYRVTEQSSQPRYYIAAELIARGRQIA